MYMYIAGGFEREGGREGGTHIRPGPILLLLHFTPISPHYKPQVSCLCVVLSALCKCRVHSVFTRDCWGVCVNY